MTAARARGILSSRHITRICGYPADQVRAVHRQQGARTDLSTTPSALTLEEVATAIADTADETTRLRLFFEFTRGANEAGLAALPLCTTEPPLIGEPRYDALLAAAAEHLSARYGLTSPLWTATAERFLSRAWWTSPLPSARTRAMVWTPAAFRRRGIYLDPHDLTHDGVAVLPDPVFDDTEQGLAFSALAGKLHNRHIVGHVHVVGAIAMILAYYPDQAAISDITACFGPKGPLVAAIGDIAAENNWAATWLDDHAVSYASRAPGAGARVFDLPHLQVAVSPPDHLLALKVLAARATRDANDVRLLCTHLHINKPEQVWTIVDRFFPETQPSSRSRALVEDILTRPPRDQLDPGDGGR